MPALKAILHPWSVCRLVCWVSVVWLWPWPSAAQDGQEAAEEIVRAPSPIAAEPEWDLSEASSAGCGSPTCLDCERRCSYFDGPYCCECGIDTRMYRSLFLARLWVEAEYLAWASSKTHLPPLLTTGVPTTPSDQAGVLGRPDTVILFGDADLHGDLRSGGRLSGGYWFTPEHRFGVEGSFFDVDVGDTKYIASGSDPFLARPITEASTGSPGRILVYYPGEYPGLEPGESPAKQSVETLVRSDVELSGAEALLRHLIQARENYRLDGVAGYRYQRLYDGLQVYDHFHYTFVGDDDEETYKTIHRSDVFDSENEFHGGEVGLIGRWWGRRWALQVLGKAALGGTRTVTTIDGSTVTTKIPSEDDEKPKTQAGGVLALPSNIGQYTQSEFAAVGELGIRVEYALTHQLYVTFGYTLIYWPGVCRVTDGIDLTVDPTQIPPDVELEATRPGFDLRSSDFWAQGLNLGMHYEF